MSEAPDKLTPEEREMLETTVLPAMRSVTSALTKALEQKTHNRDGIWWSDAPLPRRWHRCSAWTTTGNAFLPVERCACGAINYGPGKPYWMERNSRRKAKR